MDVKYLNVSRSPSTGVLQSALVSSYVAYLTFSTINAAPLEIITDPLYFNESQVCNEKCMSIPGISYDI